MRSSIKVNLLPNLQFLIRCSFPAHFIFSRRIHPGQPVWNSSRNFSSLIVPDPASEVNSRKLKYISNTDNYIRDSIKITFLITRPGRCTQCCEKLEYYTEKINTRTISAPQGQFVPA